MDKMDLYERNSWEEVLKLCKELGLDKVYPEHMYRNVDGENCPLDRVLKFIRYLNNNKTK